MDKNTLTTLAQDVYRLTVLFPTREPLRYKMREVADDIIAKFVMEDNDHLGDLRRLLEVMDSYFQIAVSQDWASPAKINESKNNYAQIGRALNETATPREEPEMRAAENPKTVQNISEAEEPESNDSKAAAGTDFVLVAEEINARIICPLPKSVEPRPLVTPMVVDQPAMPVAESVKNEPQVGGIVKKEVPAVTPIFEASREIKSSSEEEEEGDEDDEEDRGGLTSGQIARQNRIAEFLKENGSAQVWEILKIFPAISKRTIRRDFRSMLKQGLIERTGERNTTAYKLKINIS